MGLRFPSRIRLGEDLGPQQLGPPVGGEHERGQASDSGALDAVQERVELQPLLQHERRARGTRSWRWWLCFQELVPVAVWWQWRRGAVLAAGGGRRRRKP
jgi:hypothetical protein